MWEQGRKERDKKKARRSVLFCQLSLLFRAREAEGNGAALMERQLGTAKRMRVH